MLGLACVDVALVRHPCLGGVWSTNISTAWPATNIRGDQLNKLFGNCINDKTNPKPEVAIKPTTPGILDEIARPGLFPDYEYDSSIFTPQSGVVSNTTGSVPNTPGSTNDSLVAAPAAPVKKKVRTGYFAVRDQQSGCCDLFKFEPHSGAISAYDCNPNSTQVKEHNVKFRDKEQHCRLEVGHGSDSIHTRRDTYDTSLNDFFARPMLVHQEDWSAYSPFATRFNPWTDYFSHPKVYQRIANYKNLRARLHVKVMVNGNSFMYGRGMMSYQPCHTTDDFPTSISTSPLLHAVIESQRPHVFFDPNTSQGGELVLPFFWPESYFDVPNQNWSEAGEITLRDLVELRHAQGTGYMTTVTVSVFVWASDVVLTGLSAYPQMGYESEIDQANNTGAISRPASQVAELAGKLKEAPLIGKYARATEIGASGIANIATQFGYSRPPLTAAPTPMRPTPASSLANVTVPDTSNKLTLDDRQELCVDPTTTGLSSVDEMEIKEIAKKESFLTSFDWAPDDTGLLWNALVQPLWSQTGLGAGKQFFLPAVTYAALPFRYWTGTLKFRFQIVASAFHKGRLRFVYDAAATSTDPDYNVVYSEIVDISETLDFTMTVTNNQPTDILTWYKPCIDDENALHGPDPVIGKIRGNGTVAVYILNKLTTPDDSVTGNQVSVNVFLSAGDDFEVYAPDDAVRNYSFIPQSGHEISPESQTTAEPSEPFHTEADHIGMTNDADKALTSVYIGESIKSFRQLAKRYCLWRQVPTASATGAGIYRTIVTHPAFPFLRGDIGVDSGGALVNTILLHWVRMPYAGWRGSIRYKSVQSTAVSNRCFSQTAGITDGVEREYSWDSALIDSTVDPTIVANEIIATSEEFVHGHTGAALQSVPNSNVLEYEVPYQTEYRFNAWRQDDLSGEPFHMRGAKVTMRGASDGTD